MQVITRSLVGSGGFCNLGAGDATLDVVPRRPGTLRPPHDWFDVFPDGALDDGAPPGVVELAGVARRLRRLLDDGTVTVSGLARASGVDRSTIQDVLAGRVWIDTSTLARLEHTVGQRLWDVGFAP